LTHRIEDLLQICRLRRLEEEISDKNNERQEKIKKISYNYFNYYIHYIAFCNILYQKKKYIYVYTYGLFRNILIPFQNTLLVSKYCNMRNIAGATAIHIIKNI